MCSRLFAGVTPDLLVKVFGLIETPELSRRHNISPIEETGIIRSIGGQNHIDLVRWGLVPNWRKKFDKGFINARSETVAEKPSFRGLIKNRRCIVPLSGYYEWKTEAGSKLPFYICLASGLPMGIAGLWDSWKNPQGEYLETFSLLTTAANSRLESIHRRMPVILHTSGFHFWLDKNISDPAQLRNLYQPYPSELINICAVSDLDNNHNFENTFDNICLGHVPSLMDFMKL